MDDTANIDLIRQCYDSFLKGDIERLLTFMAEDIEWDLPHMEGVPYSGKRRGVEQVREFFRLVDEAQTPLEFHPGEYVAQGDRVVVFGYYNWAIKNSAVEFTSPFVHSFRLRHRKVVTFHELLDTHIVVEAFRNAAGSGTRPSLPSEQCPSIH